jgi:SAM-dependent methyltransferase
VVECNLCGWTGERFDPRFREGGRRVVCPSCLSLDRNRHLWCLLQEFAPLEEGTPVLDIAPSPALTAVIEPRCRYVSIDVEPKTPAIIPMNITRLEFPSDYFAVVLCFDVVEHVRDDDAALREMHRVLRPAGVLFLRVPYGEDLGKTDEWSEPDVHGHWRNYSPIDVVGRLGALGFHTTRANLRRERVELRLDRLDTFVARKPEGPRSRDWDYTLLDWAAARRAADTRSPRSFNRKPLST